MKFLSNYCYFLLKHGNVNSCLSLAYRLDIRHGRVLLALEDGVDLLKGPAFGFDPVDRLEGRKERSVSDSDGGAHGRIVQ